MRSLVGATLVLVLFAVGLLPVLAGEELTDAGTAGQEGVDGPPLDVNGDAISPDAVCAGVDGAVVMIHGDTRYIAGFEGGPFLRVVLSDGEILETSDVTVTEDMSLAYSRGILRGELPEVAITMYLDDDLSECAELS